MENLKGSSLIKITSIGLLIFGVLAILGNCFLLFGKGGAIGESQFAALFLTYNNQLLNVAGIIFGLFELLSGNFGIKHSKHIDAADGIFKRGLSLSILTAIIIAASVALKLFNPISICAILLPILLLIGGKMNTK
ncbi:MAG: hypothetical protein RR495_01190 [Anaerovoracaceae bacterium]